MHDALEAVWKRLFGVLDGARYERRSDLVVWIFPPAAMPQVNGPWVVEDSDDAVAALPAAVAEVDAAGAWPWVQTRASHERAREAARDLGLTHVERVPGMVVGRDEPSDAETELELGRVGP